MVDQFQVEADKALEHLHNELSTIRTGRANPALIENLMIEAYGTLTPLQQLAAISAPEPRLLVVQPWDPGVIKDIERSIGASSLGISPVVDGKLIRLPFPPMTEERRQSLVKLVNEKGEETRVRVRGIREGLMKQLKAAEKEGTLSEDAASAEQKNLQAQVDATLQQVEQHLSAKKEEIMQI